jgi:hypothetical protein
MKSRTNIWGWLLILIVISDSCKKDEVPIVTTSEITSVTATSAISGGTITDEGSGSIIACGVCWSTNITPTIIDNKTQDGAGTGTFTSNMSGLNGATTYYVRAYATNGSGTGYGTEILFTTQQATLPELITQNVTQSQNDGCLIVSTGGTIISEGGLPILSRGVCWSTNESPTILDNTSTFGTGTGSFSAELSTEGGRYRWARLTTYFLRAYATNSLGTSYGNEVSFTTPCFWDLSHLFRFISISSPSYGAVGQPTNPTLTWITPTVVVGGIGNFDVYLDTNPNPTTKIASNITSKSLPVSGLASSTTYYWKVFGWEFAYPCFNATSSIYKFTTAGLP